MNRVIIPKQMAAVPPAWASAKAGRLVGGDSEGGVVGLSPPWEPSHVSFLMQGTHRHLLKPIR